MDTTTNPDFQENKKRIEAIHKSEKGTLNLAELIDIVKDVKSDSAERIKQTAEILQRVVGELHDTLSQEDLEVSKDLLDRIDSTLEQYDALVNEINELLPSTPEDAEEEGAAPSPEEEAKDTTELSLGGYTFAVGTTFSLKHPGNNTFSRYTVTGIDGDVLVCKKLGVRKGAKVDARITEKQITRAQEVRIGDAASSAEETSPPEPAVEKETVGNESWRSVAWDDIPRMEDAPKAEYKTDEEFKVITYYVFSGADGKKYARAKAYGQDDERVMPLRELHDQFADIKEERMIPLLKDVQRGTTIWYTPEGSDQAYAVSYHGVFFQKGKTRQEDSSPYVLIDVAEGQDFPDAATPGRAVKFSLDHFSLTEPTAKSDAARTPETPGKERWRDIPWQELVESKRKRPGFKMDKSGRLITYYVFDGADGKKYARARAAGSDEEKIRPLEDFEKGLLSVAAETRIRDLKGKQGQTMWYTPKKGGPAYAVTFVDVYYLTGKEQRDEKARIVIDNGPDGSTFPPGLTPGASIEYSPAAGTISFEEPAASSDASSPEKEASGEYRYGNIVFVPGTVYNYAIKRDFNTLKPSESPNQRTYVFSPEKTTKEHVVLLKHGDGPGQNQLTIDINPDGTLKAAVGTPMARLLSLNSELIAKEPAPTKKTKKEAPEAKVERNKELSPDQKREKILAFLEDNKTVIDEDGQVLDIVFSWDHRRGRIRANPFDRTFSSNIPSVLWNECNIRRKHTKGNEPGFVTVARAYYVEQMTALIAKKNAESPEAAIAEDEQYDAVMDWCDEHLQGSHARFSRDAQTSVIFVSPDATVRFFEDSQTADALFVPVGLKGVTLESFNTSFVDWKEDLLDVYDDICDALHQQEATYIRSVSFEKGGRVQIDYSVPSFDEFREGFVDDETDPDFAITQQQYEQAVRVWRDELIYDYTSSREQVWSAVRSQVGDTEFSFEDVQDTIHALMLPADDDSLPTPAVFAEAYLADPNSPFVSVADGRFVLQAESGSGGETPEGSREVPTEVSQEHVDMLRNAPNYFRGISDSSFEVELGVDESNIRNMLAKEMGIDAAEDIITRTIETWKQQERQSFFNTFALVRQRFAKFDADGDPFEYQDIQKAFRTREFSDRGARDANIDTYLILLERYRYIERVNPDDTETLDGPWRAIDGATLDEIGEQQRAAFEELLRLAKRGKLRKPEEMTEQEKRLEQQEQVTEDTWQLVGQRLGAVGIARTEDYPDVLSVYIPRMSELVLKYLPAFRDDGDVTRVPEIVVNSLIHGTDGYDGRNSRGKRAKYEDDPTILPMDIYTFLNRELHDAQKAELTALRKTLRGEEAKDPESEPEEAEETEDGKKEETPEGDPADKKEKKLAPEKQKKLSKEWLANAAISLSLNPETGELARAQFVYVDEDGSDDQHMSTYALPEYLVNQGVTKDVFDEVHKAWREQLEKDVATITKHLEQQITDFAYMNGGVDIHKIAVYITGVRSTISPDEFIAYLVGKSVIELAPASDDGSVPPTGTYVLVTGGEGNGEPQEEPEEDANAAASSSPEPSTKVYRDPPGSSRLRAEMEAARKRYAEVKARYEREASSFSQGKELVRGKKFFGNKMLGGLAHGAKGFLSAAVGLGYHDWEKINNDIGELDEAKDAYETAMAKWRGASLERALDEGLSLAKEFTDAKYEASPWYSKAFHVVTTAGKWLGDQNIEKYITHKYGPELLADSPVKRTLLRMASLRTLTAGALIGGGTLAISSGALPVGGLMMYGARALRGVGTSAATYEFLKKPYMASLENGMTMDDIGQMKDDALYEQLGSIFHLTAMDGREITQMPYYDLYTKLEQELERRFGGNGDIHARLNAMQSAVEQQYDDLDQQFREAETAIKATAALAGVTIGTGALGAAFEYLNAAEVPLESQVGPEVEKAVDAAQDSVKSALNWEGFDSVEGVVDSQLPEEITDPLIDSWAKRFEDVNVFSANAGAEAIYNQTKELVSALDNSSLGERGFFLHPEQRLLLEDNYARVGDYLVQTNGSHALKFVPPGAAESEPVFFANQFRGTFDVRDGKIFELVNGQEREVVINFSAPLESGATGEFRIEPVAGVSEEALALDNEIVQNTWIPNFEREYTFVNDGAVSFYSKMGDLLSEWAQKGTEEGYDAATQFLYPEQRLFLEDNYSLVNGFEIDANGGHAVKFIPPGGSPEKPFFFANQFRGTFEIQDGKLFENVGGQLKEMMIRRVSSAGGESYVIEPIEEFPQT